MTDHGEGQGPYSIYLNSRPRTVDSRRQTYQSLVELFVGGAPPPDAKYTVTYELDEHTPTDELFPTSKSIEIHDGKTRVIVEETGRS